MASPAENEKVVREALAWNGVGSTPALAALAALRAQAEAGEDAREALDAAARLAAEPFGHLSERKFYALREALSKLDVQWRFRKPARAALSGEPS